MDSQNSIKLNMTMLSNAYLNMFRALKMQPKSIKHLFPASANPNIESDIRIEIFKYLKPKCVIAMLGSTNSGKSTLCNKIMLLPKTILATSVKRETDSIYQIQYNMKTSMYTLIVGKDDPKKVGNLVKGDKLEYSTSDLIKKAL